MSKPVRFALAGAGIAVLGFPALLLWSGNQAVAQSDTAVNQQSAPSPVSPTEAQPKQPGSPGPSAPSANQQPASPAVPAPEAAARGGVQANETTPQPPPAQTNTSGQAMDDRRPVVTPDVNPTGAVTVQSSDSLLKAPVTHLLPGTVNIGAKITNPVADDPAAAERGRKYFISFNCVGCHAPNGAGGMGPSLSNDKWLYGSDPAQVYLTIVQGRPRGMPAWGTMLPDNVVWDLVSYIHSITHPPTGKFGHTVSLTPLSPTEEQVPAQDIETSKPWDHTEAISLGQKPGPEGQVSGKIGTPNKDQPDKAE